MESDYERRHTKKVRANAVTIPENNVSDRDWLEERFQKMELGLRSHVQEQIAAVRQQTTYQHQRGQGCRGYRGGYRHGGGYRGGYQGNNQQTPNQQGGNNGTEQQKERNHENQGQPQQNNGDQWDPSQVVCYECFGTGHYSRGCAYRGRGGNPNRRGSGHRGGH